MKIFCKSFPPNLGGDGVLVEKYLKYGERVAEVYTVGDGQHENENVNLLSDSYTRRYIKRATEVLRDSDDLIWVHSQRLGIALRNFLKGNTVLTIHGLWGLTPRRTDTYLRWVRNILAEWTYFKFICDYPLVTTVSPYSAERLSPYVNTRYIPNGVDFDGFKEGRKERKAIFLGRHHPQKDLDFVTEIGEFLADKGFQVHIGGKPNQYSLINRWEATDGISYGYLEKREVDRWLSKSQFLLQPSRWEGFPMTLLEALNHRCLPVIRDYSGLKKLDLAEYFLTIDKHSYRETICSSIGKKIEWKEMGTLLSSKYSWKEIVKKYDESFNSIQ